MEKWGYLRETQEMATKAGIDPATGIHRTCLIDYLSVIFPNVHDWIHDKQIGEINGKKYRYKPDFRSETLKMIIEFDGLQHYTNPEQILKDDEHTRLYEKGGYKVVRIPYFIQLTNDVVEKMFGVEVGEDLFNPTVSSMAVSGKNTPAFLCPAGIKRMAREFKTYKEQYAVNVEALKNECDPFLTGVELLEKEYNELV